MSARQSYTSCRVRLAATSLASVALLLASLLATRVLAEDRRDDALLVLAPASFTDVLSEAAQLWARDGHPRPELSIAGTPTLARQLLSGAPADLFISADDDWMDRLVAAHVVDPKTRVLLATNRLVCVVPGGAARAPTVPADLVQVAFRRIAVGAETVPAGRYARAAFSALGIDAALAPRLISFPDVRAALAMAERGEVDAAIVYASDAHARPRVKAAFSFAAGTHPPIVYPAAVVASSSRRDAAHAFLRFLESAELRAVFAREGFGLPP